MGTVGVHGWRFGPVLGVVLAAWVPVRAASAPIGCREADLEPAYKAVCATEDGASTTFSVPPTHTCLLRGTATALSNPGGCFGFGSGRSARDTARVLLGRFPRTEGRRDTRFTLWSTETGAVLRRIAVHGARPAGFAITPDDGQVVSCSEAGEMLLWDLDSGQVRLRLQSVTRPLTTLVVSDDGSTLAATGDKEPFVGVWSLRDGALRWSTLLGRAPIRGCVALNRNGSRLLYSTYWETALVSVDLVEGREVARYTSLAPTHTAAGGLLSPERVVAVRFAPDDRLVAVSQGRTIALYAPATLTSVRALIYPACGSLSEAVEGLDFTADGRRLLAWGRTARLTLWDVETGALLQRFQTVDPPRHITSGSVQHAAFSRDGRGVTALRGPWKASRWDLPATDPEDPFAGYRPEPRPEIIARTLIADAYAKDLGAVRRRIGTPEEPCFSPDASVLLLCTTRSAPERSTCLTPATGAETEWDGQRAAAFFGLLPRYGTGFSEAERTSWVFERPEGDVADRRVLELPWGPGGDTIHLVITPDQTRCLASSWGRPGCRLLNLQTGEELWHAPYRPYQRAFSPDSQLMVGAAAEDGGKGCLVGIRLSNGQVTSRIPYPDGGRRVEALALANNGRALVRFGGWTEVHVQDILQGRPVMAFLEHPTRVTGMAISADGELASSVEESGRVYVWRVRPDPSLDGTWR